ncbi:MAG: AI-2E family transporter, partial [Isosphaeraceae bacterium]
EAQSTYQKALLAILAFGAMSFLGPILIPFAFGLFLAIALSPLAERLERLGMNRTFSSLACLSLVTAVLLLIAGLVGVQAGVMVQNSDKYLHHVGQTLNDLSDRTGSESFLGTLGVLEKAESRPEGADGTDWENLVRGNLRGLGRWVVTGLGGLVGVLAGVVMLLAYLFYMLLTRADWIGRIRRAASGLGLRPTSRRLEAVRGQISTYINCLLGVSAGYVVVTTLVLWAIGVPQPLLWGVITGLLEFIPYLGPMLAVTLPTLAALGAGGSWWQPAAVVGYFVALQTVEGYVISPVLYGRAVEIDPVTVLFGVLFFGFLWGPAGLALAMPMMILLRGLVTITPETPALDALAAIDQGKDAG